VLNESRVLDYILPELTLGRDMVQRPDFHKYDVLEHSLRAALYAPPSVRLAALLHDVGKPFCFHRDGNSYAHPQEGARIAKEILTRLKAPKRTIEHTARLIEAHMYDFNCQTKENKLRRYLVENYPILNDLFSIKQADFSACMDDISPAPTCVRWTALLEKMQAESVPFTLRELAVSGKDLQSILPPQQIGQTLTRLLLHVACNPLDNKKDKLLRLAMQK
jgi:tRNA nucleotidyltransferase (CCA-adding enzyme)